MLNAMAKLWSVIVAFGYIGLAPSASYALSVAAQPAACEIPNPCAESTSQSDKQSCAKKAADWIVLGTFQQIGGVPTVEPATVLKGKPPLLSYRDGKFYLWRSCWALTESPGTQVKVYGMKDGGVFLSIPQVSPAPPLSPARPFHPYCC
jgi:hypothetical protein